MYEKCTRVAAGGKIIRIVGNKQQTTILIVLVVVINELDGGEIKVTRDIAAVFVVLLQWLQIGRVGLDYRLTNAGN